MTTTDPATTLHNIADQLDRLADLARDDPDGRDPQDLLDDIADQLTDLCGNVTCAELAARHAVGSKPTVNVQWHDGDATITFGDAEYATHGSHGIVVVELATRLAEHLGATVHTTGTRGA